MHLSLPSFHGWVQQKFCSFTRIFLERTFGGFQLRLLIFPFVYQFNSRIAALVCTVNHLQLTSSEGFQQHLASFQIRRFSSPKKINLQPQKKMRPIFSFKCQFFGNLGLQNWQLSLKVFVPTSKI